MSDTVQLDYWRGNFGNEYVARNDTSEGRLAARRAKWQRILNAIDMEKRPNSILEVGANIGLNLQALRSQTDADLYGLEPNDSARQRMVNDGIIPSENILNGTAQSIPLPDGAVELAFTSGVLIHIHPDNLSTACAEISRVTNRYIVCIEYFSSTPTSIPYRGRDDLLFKRDFGSYWMDQEPNLKVIDYGFFWKPLTTLDNLTWWIFEKS